MTQFDYERDIPFEDNNPSVDQPDMKINTNSIMDLLAVDHITFNLQNGGAHTKVQLQEGVYPVGLQNGFETLYAKVATGANPANSGELFFTRGVLPFPATPIEIQMTSRGIVPLAITPTYGSAFPNNPTDQPIGPNFTFITFLPGNAVMISGFITGCRPITTVTFGINITNIYSVQLTRLASEAGVLKIGRSFHQVTGLGAIPGSFSFRNLDADGDPSFGQNVMWTLFGVL